MRRLFYTSTFDHHDLTPWGAMADKLRRAVAASCGQDVAVDIGDGPVWAPGVDEEETLAGLAEMRLHRQVRIDLWSAVEHHGAIALTLGSEIRRPERRALERKLKKTLRGEALLREHEGPYDDESAWVFGYAMSAARDAAARADIDHLLYYFDPPFYVGERWIVQGEDERLDESSYEHIHELAPGIVSFTARSGDAAERVWQRASAGDGLVVCFADDPAIPGLVQRFSTVDDLRLFLAKKPYSGARVTIDRGGDGQVVAYSPVGPPEIEAPYLFLI